MNPITELRELLSKATPGPWVARKSMSNDCSIVTQSQPGEPLTCFSVGRMADAALIVAAVNALPGLLDERDRLAGEVERLRIESAAFRELANDDWFHDVAVEQRDMARALLQPKGGE